MLPDIYQIINWCFPIMQCTELLCSCLHVASSTGLSENGWGVQRPGGRRHCRSRGGLAEYDRLQKGKADGVLQHLSCTTVETSTEKQWPVDMPLTAHWSVSVGVYHALVSLSEVSESLSLPETSSALSLQDPTTVSITNPANFSPPIF